VNGRTVFPSPQKPTFPNSNSIWTQWKKSHPVDPLLIPIYFFLFFSSKFTIEKMRNDKAINTGREGGKAKNNLALA